MAKRLAGAAALVAAAMAVDTVGPAWSDEGGVSFWAPGLYGSLAAVPAQPGWSAAAVLYHGTVDATGNKTFKIGGGVQAGLEARANLMFLSSTYVFASPVLGAQAAIGVASVVARMDAAVSATLTGPNGSAISGSRSQDVTGFGDLYPQATLKWNSGVHNFMLYTVWGLPVGRYDPNRLANIGIGHWSGDAGAGYTYFDPQTGHEFSAVAGFTYNFKNPYTDYKNGIDFHLDWGASQFLSKQLHVGVVGYVYQQVTGDSGSGATLGDFKSRVFGIGPQVGYLFPVGDMQGYVNLKGYYEFGAQNRPEGWNVWLALQISPAAAPPPQTRLVHK